MIYFECISYAEVPLICTSRCVPIAALSYLAVQHVVALWVKITLSLVFYSYLHINVVPFKGNIRNLAMEKVASTVLFPCKFASTGCQFTMLHTDKGDHEEACEFRPYSCPCPGASCKWSGPLEHVMPHLLNQHRSITTLQGMYILQRLLSGCYTLIKAF